MYIDFVRVNGKFRFSVYCGGKLHTIVPENLNKLASFVEKIWRDEGKELDKIWIDTRSLGIALYEDLASRNLPAFSLCTEALSG
jgi:hypothetical protein